MSYFDEYRNAFAARNEPATTIEMLCADSDDPMIMVYYHDADMAYYTPWGEQAAQHLAESEDGKGKFYFMLEEVPS